MDERLESSWRLVYYGDEESQGSLTVVVDRTFNSGSMDLFTDHCCVILFFACLIFKVGLNREIFLTVKFSQSLVHEEWHRLFETLTLKFYSCYSRVTYSPWRS